jgi:hypothetical protein
MAQEESISNCSVCNIAKIVWILLSCIPNVILVAKIISLLSVQTLFNLGLVTFFAISAIFGPLLLYFYLQVFEQQFGLNNLQERRSSCAYMMEFRNAIGESLRIIGVNFMFRFLFVVFADKGLSVRGKVNDTLLKWVMVAITFGRYSFNQAFESRVWMPFADSPFFIDKCNMNTEC